jgi:hypothetical protein
MVRLGLIACVMVASFPIAAANAQTFGLGVSSDVHVTVSTFGLGPSVVAITSTSPTKQEVVKPDTPPPVAQSRTVVVRVARSSWADSSVGAWTVETLRSHLRGELASGQHRGRVPMAELEGRTLRELKDIHDNLHEGYAWNGRTVTRTVQTYQSNCPGGVCPTPSYQPVRRLFRR